MAAGARGGPDSGVCNLVERATVLSGACSETVLELVSLKALGLRTL